MKNRIYSLLIMATLAAIITGCSKESDKEPDPTLSLSPATTAVVFSADGKTATSGGTALTPNFTVTTNQTAWDVQVTPAGSWCTATKSGSTFTLTAVANPSITAPEPATVTVTAGNAQPVTISVTQFGADAALAISPVVEALEFSASGTKVFIGTQEVAPNFAVTTNQTSWEVTVTPAGSWCRAAKTEDGNGFTLTADINRATSAPDQATVTVTADDADPITITVTQKPAVYDIYLVGMTQDAGLSGWRNAEPLFTGTNNPNSKFYPYQMTVSNGKIYTAGQLILRNTYLRNTYAAVYEDGREKYRLTAGSASGDDGEAGAIAVLNGDIYTAGYEHKSGSNYYYYNFWKNGGSGSDGSTVSLTSSTEAASVTDMEISGSRFLLCGSLYDNDNDYTQATFFSSGPDLNFTAIPLAANVYSYAHGMAVRGDDVLIAGEVEESEVRPVLWSVNAEGVVTESTPAGSANGRFTDIAVEGEDVYLLLIYQDTEYQRWMKVLRNGEEVPGCTMAAMMTNNPRIAVAGGDIYWVAVGGVDGESSWTYDVYKNGNLAWRVGNALNYAMLEVVMRE